MNICNYVNIITTLAVSILLMISMCFYYKQYKKYNLKSDDLTRYLFYFIIGMDILILIGNSINIIEQLH
jgi:hypothetical protein